MASISRVVVLVVAAWCVLPPGGGSALAGTWANTYGSASAGLGAFSVCPTDDGGFAAVGIRLTGFNSYAGWITKLDASGAVVWDAAFPFGLRTFLREVRERPNGDIVLTGWIDNAVSFTSVDHRLIVMELDPGGTTNWLRIFDIPGLSGSAGTAETGRSLDLLPGGGLVVAGTHGATHVVEPDAWVLRLTPSGSMLWVRSFGAAGARDILHSVRSVPGGSGSIAAGQTDAWGAGDHDAWVLRLDSAGGVIWQRTYGGPGEEVAYSVEPTSDGGYVVAGYTTSFGNGAADAWILKLDAAGDVDWEHAYGSPGFENAVSVEETADGGFIAAVATSPPTGGVTAAALLRLDAHGGIEWHRGFGDPAVTTRPEAARQAQDCGHVLVGYALPVSGGVSDGEALGLRVDSEGRVDAACGFARDVALLRLPTAAIVTPSAAIPAPVLPTVLGPFQPVGPTVPPTETALCAGAPADDPFQRLLDAIQDVPWFAWCGGNPFVNIKQVVLILRVDLARSQFQAGNCQAATAMIANSVVPHVDGCPPQPDANDWICSCGWQASVKRAAEDLLDRLACACP